jgi:excisionase family DNA binding protein
MNYVPAGFQQNTASRAEAAKYLGVSVSTLARWGWKGDGPAYYVIGAKARYRLSDLDKFIETKRQGQRVG